jgi:predicted membrane-bound spermidine synthase
MCLAPIIVAVLPALFVFMHVVPVIKMLVFCLCMILIGYIGGRQFPIANSLFLKASGDENREIGSLYGLDLFGSAVGAALISLFLIPLIGIIHTLILLASLNVISLIALFTYKKTSDH